MLSRFPVKRTLNHASALLVKGSNVVACSFVQQQNGNVSWQRRAQIKQLARPIAERQIEHRKSCLVFSTRFPVVNWRSRPVAKSAYCRQFCSVCLRRIEAPWPSLFCLCQPCSEFEQDAIGVLQECYEENETLSQTLLVKELESFGHLTALDLAVMAEDQNFIAHVSCQELLTRLWMGTMAMNTRWWKVRELYFVIPGG